MPRGQGEQPPDDGGIGGSADLAELEAQCRQVEADWQKVVEGLPELEAELERLLAGIDWGELERQLAAVLETDLAGGVGPPPLGGG